MKRLAVIQPFLFAIYPILLTFCVNVDILSLRELELPILVVGLATVLLWLPASKFVGSGKGAGIVVSVFWLLFFSYARLRDALGLTQDLALVVILTVLCALVASGVKRYHKCAEKLSLVVTAVGLTLVLMPTFIAIPPLIQHQQAHVALSEVEAPVAGPDERPDIYYIILDGYARGDVLEDLYGYDNSPFLDWLTEKGFYVAQHSEPNYSQTYLSLASSLNLCYLDDVVSHADRDSSDRAALVEMVQENAVARFLKQQGYTYATFTSGYFERELGHADVHFAGSGSLTTFSLALMGMTPLSSLRGLQYDLYRGRLLYALDHLQDAAELPPPVFVFAHILAPHWPYVFGAQGESITPGEPFALTDASDDAGAKGELAHASEYTGQLSFVNVKVQEAIDAIISKSSRPPIIVLQSDHGPGTLNWSGLDPAGLRNRMSILNAYYLPGSARGALYDDITPVNTFRIIFNECFGADYALLDDESYVSSYDHPYQLTRVPAPSQ